MIEFLRISCFFALPIFVFASLLIWRPVARPGRSKSASDRIAWTLFALGICLMINMVLYSAAQEGDGNFRTWETTQLHKRVFLGIAMIPIAGPLIVYACQFARKRADRAIKKKSRVDDWS
ncbi:hypothetical protein P12x_000972 [Tundrisphaera lichenicola]|uniref:hypothetical protein n=1 Tax=Tundrisphaera lichenicola TaxID=2029860 RepID=UPI003EBBB8BF